MAHALPPRHGLRPARGLLAAVMVVVAGLALALAQTSPGHALLRSAGLDQPPASYTSLAFTSPQSLPAYLAAVPTPVTISFTVSNSSADPRSYHWSVVVQRAGRANRLSAGEVAVQAGERATVARTVTASCSAGQARMSVQLAAPAESIAFWLACSPRGGPAGAQSAATTAFLGCVPSWEGSGA
jgi:hypothetical protein